MNFIKSTSSAVIIVLINIITLLFSKFTNPYGFPLIIIGLFIYFYHKHLMGSVWSPDVKPKKQLITKGLFNYLRHPLYFGLLLAYAGFILSTLSLLLMVVFIFVNVPYVYKRALVEEDLLSRKLKGYKSYMKRTGRFMPKFS